MDTIFDEAYDNNFLKIYPSQGNEGFEQENGVKPLPLKKSLTCNPLITLITREALLGRNNDFVRLLPVCSNSKLDSVSKSRDMFDQVGGLSREEVAGMIERATSNFLKTMKGEHTISPFIGVFPCVCMRPTYFRHSQECQG